MTSTMSNTNAYQEQRKKEQGKPPVMAWWTNLRLLPVGTDIKLLLTVLALMSLGIIMIASASVSYAAENYGDSFYFLKRHLAYAVLGLMTGAIAIQVPLKFWYRYANVLVALVAVLLVAVLIPGIGREVNGAQRWIGLGIINLQVAEVAKLAAIVFIAAYLQRNQVAMAKEWHSFFKPLAVVGVMIALLMMQPDFGSSVVILAMVMGLLFLGGLRLWVFLVLLSLAAALIALLTKIAPYRMQRLTSFRDPWENQFDSGYQLVQSLIAFGKGEWLGVGLGNSIQKLLYLPEAHTDFVFAIFAEEMGFLGVLLVIGLFVYLIQRVLLVARKAAKRQDWFATYVVFGVVMLIAGQAFINIGVTSGLLPTKGLTLPFMSYGGSSLIICCLMVALVLRIGIEMDNAYWLAKKQAVESGGKNKAVLSKSALAKRKLTHQANRGSGANRTENTEESTHD